MSSAIEKNREFYEQLKGFVSFEKNYTDHKNFVNKYVAHKYGCEDITEVPDELLVETTMTLLMALIDEAQEVLRELPWKPWKADHKDTSKIDIEALREEIVDIQHFVNNLVMVWFDSPEQFNMYFKAKLDENARRQEEGY